MDRRTLIRLSQSAIADWNTRRLDDFYARFDVGVIYHAPDGQTLAGVHALRSHYDLALAWCPDLHIQSIVVVADADANLLASVQREQGTAVDGSSFGFEGMTFFRLNDNGLICEVWEQIRPFTGQEE